MKGQLRALNEDDLEMVLEWRNHPEVRRYMYSSEIINLSEHTAWFQMACNSDNLHLFVYEENNKSKGFVKLKVIDEGGKIAEWGFYLSPNASKGTGVSLGNATLNYAFNVLKLHKIFGEVLEFNVRSLRFHERMGFKRECVFENHHHDGESYHSVVSFSLMADDWKI